MSYTLKKILKTKYVDYVTKSSYFKDNGKKCLDRFNKHAILFNSFYHKTKCYYKKKHWVDLYANSRLHMNNRTSSRVETTHSVFKFHITHKMLPSTFIPLKKREKITKSRPLFIILYRFL